MLSAAGEASWRDAPFGQPLNTGGHAGIRSSTLVQLRTDVHRVCPAGPSPRGALGLHPCTTQTGEWGEKDGNPFPGGEPEVESTWRVPGEGSAATGLRGRQGGSGLLGKPRFHWPQEPRIPTFTEPAPAAWPHPSPHPPLPQGRCECDLSLGKGRGGLKGHAAGSRPPRPGTGA